jgi:hypothetical protein
MSKNNPSHVKFENLIDFLKLTFNIPNEWSKK